MFVEDVHRSDFNKLIMDDLWVEDINTIIEASARGIMEKGILNRLESLEQQIDDHLTPSLYKYIVGKVAGFTSARGSSLILRRLLMAPNPRVSYNKKGWVGKREYNLRNKCGVLSP